MPGIGQRFSIRHVESIGVEMRTDYVANATLRKNVVEQGFDCDVIFNDVTIATHFDDFNPKRIPQLTLNVG